MVWYPHFSSVTNETAIAKPITGCLTGEFAEGAHFSSLDESDGPEETTPQQYLI